MREIQINYKNNIYQGLVIHLIFNFIYNISPQTSIELWIPVCTARSKKLGTDYNFFPEFLSLK